MSRIGKPGHRRFRWQDGTDLVEVVSRIEEALASLQLHPGPERFDFDAATTAIGEIYAQQIAAAFGESATDNAASV